MPQQPKPYTLAKFRDLEAQIADLRDERRELIQRLHRLEQENDSLRDHLRSEHQRNNSMATKLGAVSPQWTRPGFSDCFDGATNF